MIKDDDLTTTKIRPVFNCSLEVRNPPSLNETVYPGINLVNYLLDLLLYFRSNCHVFMTDIRKAFLMIKLKSEVDKNCFCFFFLFFFLFFFVREDENVGFRYTKLIFGFVASPFIKNFLIQFHLDKYKGNECAGDLKNRSYVNNLLVTNENYQN